MPGWVPLISHVKLAMRFFESVTSFAQDSCVSISHGIVTVVQDSLAAFVIWW